MKLMRIVWVLLGVVACQAAANAQYIKTNLVSDGAVPALHTDANLKNAWGLAASPGATGSFFWVANNGTGTSTLYDGNGVAQSLVVSVPGVPSGTGNPTGVVFNGGSNFMVTDGVNTGAVRFLFASEDGSISGWSPTVPAGSTVAHTAVTHTGIYKGLALGSQSGQDRLFAANFHNGAIDTFDGAFGEQAAAFIDPNLPVGYAPFNIANLNGNLYVSYAKQDAAGEDDDPGAGHGLIDVFSTSGTFMNRLVDFNANNHLNSPWGMTIAPSDFGPLSNALLVGNFGDGTINAFDPTTGAYLDTLKDASNAPLVIDGLWALQFGNGNHNQPANTLFFTAGPNGEANGLYGRIDLPEPATIVLAAVSLLILRRR